jgi:hypothetical protein
METINGETCISVKNLIRDQMILRNGCKGGVLKQVLDYSVQRDQQNCFHPDGASPREIENTTSVAKARNAAGASVDNPGRTQTITALPKYKNAGATNTAEENRRAGKLASICESKGQGYKAGDLLRVVGGTPTSESSVLRTQVVALRIINAGAGYLGGQSIELQVNTTDATSSPLRYDISQLGFDENGGLRGVNVSLDNENTAQYGKVIPGGIPGAGLIPMVIKANGDIDGGLYNKKHAPTITVKGSGTGAVVVPVMGYDNDDLFVERPAKFMVTEVDAQGGIVDLSVQDRGIYEQFPSDLDQGVPMEYDVERPIHGAANKQANKKTMGNPAVLGTAGGPGKGRGARIFLTSRSLPDCSQKGNALNAMGLGDGVVPNITMAEQFADNLNQWAPYGPDGLPLWNAQIEPDAEGNSGLVIYAPGLSGLDFGDELNPGLLDLLGMYPGAYTVDNPLEVNLSDTGDGGGPYGDGTGLRFSRGDLGGLGPDGLPFNVHSNNNKLTNRMDGALYQYDLSDLRGGTATLIGKDQKNVTALKLNSLRYSTPPANIASMANVWVDNYDTNGWAYLESNTC